MSARLSLVTGGGGFIGRHLVRLLAERGERVRVLDPEPGDGFVGDVELVPGSVLDPAAVRRALKRADRVYHLAANPNLWAPRKAEFVRLHVGGIRTVLDEAARHGVERIVHTSSATVLAAGRAGAGPGGGDGGEAATRRALRRMPGPYSRSKLLAEREALAAARAGQPVVVVSPTLPIGPGDRRLTPPTRMILDFVNGRTPAYLERTVNLVDVRDAALGHILAAERGRIGERYVLCGETLGIRAVLDLLHGITGRAMPRLRVPYWLACLAAAVAEGVADHLTRKAPVAPLEGVRLVRRPMAFDGAEAVRALGLPCTPARRALADAVDWLDGRDLVRPPLRARPPGAAP